MRAQELREQEETRNRCESSLEMIHRLAYTVCFHLDCAALGETLAILLFSTPIFQTNLQILLHSLAMSKPVLLGF